MSGRHILTSVLRPHRHTHIQIHANTLSVVHTDTLISFMQRPLCLFSASPPSPPTHVPTHFPTSVNLRALPIVTCAQFLDMSQTTRFVLSNMEFVFLGYAIVVGVWTHHSLSKLPYLRTRFRQVCVPV